MKRSKNIVLLFSGALATIGTAGCSDRDPPPPPPQGKTVAANQLRDDQDQDNNSYVPGFGYYHALSHGWFPYPFNWFSPGHGYFYSGGWQDRPFQGPVPVQSRPSPSALSEVHAFARTGIRSNFSGNSGGSHGSGFGGGSAEGGFSSVSRGGFGSSAGHGGGGGE